MGFSALLCPKDASNAVTYNSCRNIFSAASTLWTSPQHRILQASERWRGDQKDSQTLDKHISNSDKRLHAMTRGRLRWSGRRRTGLQCCWAGAARILRSRWRARPACLSWSTSRGAACSSCRSPSGRPRSCAPPKTSAGANRILQQKVSECDVLIYGADSDDQGQTSDQP